MRGWRWRVVGLGLGLCLGTVGCGGGSPPPSPSDSCEATASCGDRRQPPPEGNNPGQPPGDDAGTPPGNDAGTPPQDGGTAPPSDGGTSEPKPTPTGETLWQQYQRQDRAEYAASVSATSDGQALYTATEEGSLTGARRVAGGSNAKLTLRRLTSSGQVQWTESFPLYAFEGTPPEDVWGNIRLSVGPTGNPYVILDVHQGWAEVNAGLFSGLMLFKFGPDGFPKWSKQLPSTDRFLAMTASRDDGTFVSVVTTYPYSEELRCAPQEGAVYRFDANGAQLWRVSLGAPQCGGFRTEAASLAAQPEGGVALGGSFSGELRVGAELFTTQTQSPFLGVLDARGGWSWVKAFPTLQGQVTSVGSSAKGTVVVTGTLQRGALRWGNDSLGEVPSFLLVAEATGEPRWGKSLGRSERPVLAVEPAGRVVVAGLSRDYPKAAPGSQDPTQNPQLFVRRFNLAGKQLWNRFFARSGGPSNLFTEEFTSAAPSGEGNGNTLLFGHFSHTEDFGRGAITPSGTDAVLLKVGPGPEF